MCLINSNLVYNMTNKIGLTFLLVWFAVMAIAADYSYDLGDKGGGSGVIFLDESFPDQKPGSAAVTGYSFDEEGVASLRIETAVLNEDGTVTFAVYRVKR